MFRLTLKRLTALWNKFLERRKMQDSEVRERQISSLVDGASLSEDYIVLTVASCTIATFGLLENSPAVIIGAMIIAPLMTAIQASAYGALERSGKVFSRAAATLGVGVLCAIVASALLAKIIGLSAFGSEVLSRTRPNLLDLGIALAAGAVGGFARARPSLANAVAGTAIAVALMPPLCVAGIGIANADWEISRGAALLFATNLLGITLASMVVFLVTGFARLRGGAALVWTLALTAALLIPLTLSLNELVRETSIENALRYALTEQTATFRQATLVSSTFDWLTQPPTATLLVRSNEILSAHQVSLLEAFAQHVTGQEFHLVVDVSQIERVTSAATKTKP